MRNLRFLVYKRGFTLIELLIVVAIIAILAAIAVPNFLEAQTRAKVSKSKADMRTLLVATESYRVDYNSIPPYDGDHNQEPDWWGYTPHLLTTPIAYITSLPFQPFYDKGLHPGSQIDTETTQLYTYIYNVDE